MRLLSLGHRRKPFDLLLVSPAQAPGAAWPELRDRAAATAWRRRALFVRSAPQLLRVRGIENVMGSYLARVLVSWSLKNTNMPKLVVQEFTPSCLVSA